MANDDLADEGGDVEQREYDGGRELVGQRAGKHRDVERDREMRKPLQDVRKCLRASA